MWVWCNGWSPQLDDVAPILRAVGADFYWCYPNSFPLEYQHPLDFAKDFGERPLHSEVFRPV